MISMQQHFRSHSHDKRLKCLVFSFGDFLLWPILFHKFTLNCTILRSSDSSLLLISMINCIKFNVEEHFISFLFIFTFLNYGNKCFAQRKNGNYSSVMHACQTYKCTINLLNFPLCIYNGKDGCDQMLSQCTRCLEMLIS